MKTLSLANTKGKDKSRVQPYTVVTRSGFLVKVFCTAPGGVVELLPKSFEERKELREALNDK